MWELEGREIRGKKPVCYKRPKCRFISYNTPEQGSGKRIKFYCSMGQFKSTSTVKSMPKTCRCKFIKPPSEKAFRWALERLYGKKRKYYAEISCPSRRDKIHKRSIGKRKQELSRKS